MGRLCHRLYHCYCLGGELGGVYGWGMVLKSAKSEKNIDQKTGQTAG
jgi:hypothetical protein